MHKHFYRLICTLLALLMSLSAMPISGIAESVFTDTMKTLDVTDYGTSVLSQTTDTPDIEPNIPEVMTDHLAIAPVTFESSAEQVAEQPAGAQETVTVTQPTALDMNARLGDTIQWSFTASGADTLTYAVYCDGALLEEAGLPTNTGAFSWTTGQVGNHTLCITATGAGGTAADTSQPVLVSKDEALSAILTADRETAVIGESISLTATVRGGTQPHQSAIITVLCNDETIGSYEGTSTQITVQSAGHYVATFQTTDAAGQTAEASCEFDVSDMALDDLASLAPNVLLTGNAGVDMAAIARSQIGYQESTEGHPENGGSGYTLYGNWFDLLYNGGIGSAEVVCGPWNATFASYCAYYAYADLPNDSSIASMFHTVRQGENHADGSYPANAGDVLFRDTNGDGEADRVGIIVDKNADTMEVVEGDVSGTVAKVVCSTSDGDILGYAIIATETLWTPQPEEPFNPESILVDMLQTDEPIVESAEQDFAAEQILGMMDEADTPEVLAPEPMMATEVEGTPLSISQISVASRQVFIGDEIHWIVQAEGGQGALAYQYRIVKDGEMISEMSTISSALTYAAATGGCYILTASVTDESGQQAELQDSEVLVIQEESDRGYDMPMSLDYQGGVTDRETPAIKEAVSDDAPLTMRAINLRASLNDLEVAYITCSASTLELNQNATWTIHASGGDGVYTYQMALYYQAFSATDNNYSRVALKPYSSNNTMTYKPTLAGRYALLSYIKDTSGRYLSWESPVYLTRDVADVNDTSTVAGKVAWVVSEVITGNMTDREKAKALHDWLIFNANYDHSYTYYHADGVLLYGKGVCQSYAQAYRMLCLEAGLECIFVPGTAGTTTIELHAWNLVKIDGVWLHVDCTWDDLDGAAGITYKYFLITDDAIKADHSWNTDWTSKNTIDSILPSENLIPVTSISLNTSTLTLAKGDTQLVTATVVPSTATYLRPDWTSSNPSVATVDTHGMVTAVAVGTTTITATTHNNLKKTVAVTVSNSKTLTALALNKTGTQTLNMNNTLQLSALKTPTDATTTLTWSSSNPTVATVTNTGLVTPENGGTTTITVRASNGLTASVAVTVVDPNQPMGISLSPSGTQTLAVNNTLKLTATLKPATAVSGVTWKSSDASVATVDTSGIVSAVKEGTVTITVTAVKTNHTASIAVRVLDPNKPTSVALNVAGKVELALGNTLPLIATLAPSTAQSDLVWTSSTPAVATVNASGIVTPLRTGLATITVTAVKSNLSATVRVQVVKASTPASVALNVTGTVDVGFGTTLPLVATMIPSTAQSALVWKTSTASVATVDGNGVVTGVKEGTARITVTVAGTSKSAFVNVRVVNPDKPTGVTLNYQGTVEASTGTTLTLVATMSPLTAQSSLLWKTSAAAIASVDANGIVTPLKTGTATITVTATSGNRSASVRVKVVDPYKPTGIQLDRTGTIDMTASETCQLVATLVPSTAQAPIVWKTSSTAIATVDSNGLVTAVKEGTVTITAQETKSNRRATVRVKITDPNKPTRITLDHSGIVDITTQDTLKLTATLVPSTAQAPITWKTSSTAIATVDANGLVTPLKEGTVTVTVQETKTRRSASVRVRITDPNRPTGIAIDGPNPATVSMGETLWLQATLQPATSQSAISWRSSSTAIATVTDQGIVTPLREGTVTITATANNTNRSANIRVRVVDPNKPTDLLLNYGGTVELSLRDMLTIGAQVFPSTAQTQLSWRSSAESIAAVDGNGVVTPLSVGTVMITVSASNMNKRATVRIRIYDPDVPKGIAIHNRSEPIPSQLGVDDTLRLETTIHPQSARTTITWRSSSPSIATVSEDGVVTALKPGRVTITAMTDNTLTSRVVLRVVQ